MKNHFLNIYSYLDNPRGFPGRFNYVPTLVGLSGYTTCQYALNGKVLTIVFVANAIGVTGTAPSISLPSGVSPSPSTMPDVFLCYTPSTWYVSGLILASPILVYKTAALGAWLGTEISVTLKFIKSLTIS